MSHPRLRSATPSDIPTLQSIELAALELFRDHVAYPSFAASPTSSTDLEAHIAANDTWVAVDSDDVPIGFVIVSTLGDEAYLSEVDVHPDHARQGIGKALIAKACDLARARGHTTIALSTLSDVPWNAPLYAALGWTPIATTDLSEPLLAHRHHESALGFPMHLRVLMRRHLQS
jgi:4-diphosphocytidyl-2-C-methyl-D-erythritol kinase